MSIRRAGAAFLLGVAAVTPAWAGLADSLSAEPPTWEVADWELRVSGFVSGSLYSADEAGGPALRGGFDDSGVTGQARVNLRLQRTYDSGLVLGAKSSILAYHDTLSGDRYGNDTFETLYVYAQTAFGTVEVGQVDGAASRLGVTGPKVDDHVGLDDPDTAFFTNPTTGHRFDIFFYPYAASWGSANDAKLSFISTRILGIQAGVSISPEQVKAPLPFIGNPSSTANQAPIWEAAVSYTGFVADDLAVEGSLAYTQGYLQEGLPGRDDLYDWAAGAAVQYAPGAVKLTVGGAYRASNAYGFNPWMVLDHSQTRLAHASALVEWEAWRAGAEYSHGEVNGPVGLPDYTMEAYQVAGGYRINDNMQLTAGWQWFDYSRDLGVFFNGRPATDMNAAFATLGYTL